MLAAFVAGIWVEKTCQNIYGKSLWQVTMDVAELGQGAVQMHKESPIARVNFDK